MPRFDVRCKKCAHVHEATVAFGVKTMPKCPACGSKATEKLLSAPGILFKGEGFYKTDSRPAEAKETPTAPEPTKETPKPETKAPKAD